MKHSELRRAIIEVAVRLNENGLNSGHLGQGTSGNVGARIEGGFLVTPTGMAFEALEPGDLVEMTMEGSAPGRQRRPSSEWRMHRDIFAARDEVGAVIHAHAMFATTLACLGRDIPAFHYMVAVAGGDDIRCAPYATFGTDQLSANALAALEGRWACLLANHGMIALGRDLDHACHVAAEVETLAALYWRALQVGEPTLLGRREMARVVKKFKSYGQPRP